MPESLKNGRAAVWVALLAIFVAVVTQWATLGFGVPTRAEVTSGFAAHEQKLDGMKKDLEILKIQLARVEVMIQQLQIDIERQENKKQP